MSPRLLTPVCLSLSLIVDVFVFAVETPICVDPSIEVTLVASEPAIVTPVSCRFDSRGRLFVVESHTHFPPENYDGPKTDRIKLFDDPDGDGTLDRIRIFHEGTVKTMGLGIGRDNSVYLLTRAAILRLRDTNGDDVADETTTLVTLDTKADYPHNGLSGLLVEDSEGTTPTLTFGLGENFGETYVLSGSDGLTQIGGGEGGNIFRCSIDGSGLERIATGFWNPFGICRDYAGRLLVVDNDADAMPPCRIVNVMPKADYGFQFRFGRAGTHPLQAWNGEVPGTLPMVAGTGEAPCAIMSYRGQYWVTSWGDNRIERYTPEYQNDSIKADRDVAIQGDAMFRPVDMAVAPDGSMYITDWVDRSYNVHRKGRIWRVKFTTPSTNTLAEEQKSAGELRAESLAEQEPTDVLSRLMRQRWKTIAEPLNEVVIADRAATIRKSLESEDESLRFAAVRWATETGDKAFLPQVKTQLERDSLSPRMVAAVASSISYLETGNVEKGGFDALTRKMLVDIALDESKNELVRQIAIRLVPPDSPQWSIDDLKTIVATNQGKLSREAARHIAVAASSNAKIGTAIDSLINTKTITKDVKLDLAVGLPQQASAYQEDDPRPAVDDLDAWMKLVGEGGDAENGWRVFFSTNAGKCSSCHARDGRGASVGPQLTSLAGTIDRRRLLDSILHPSHEIGPMYTTWKVLTTDGRAIAGLKLNGGGVGQSARYLLADATTVDVPLEDIDVQEASTLSIMPQGLEKILSIEQIRDLLAYLSTASP